MATLSAVSVSITIADILNIQLVTSFTYYKFCSPAYCETIYFFTYLTVPCSTVLEKLTGSQTVNKCPTYYGT